MEKDRGIRIPFTLFTVKKDAANALPLAVVMVVLFPFFVTNLLTMSLYLFIALFFFLHSAKILVPRELLITAGIMLLGVLIMAYSYDTESIMTVSVPPIPHSNVVSNSMFLTSAIGFVVFIQGYLYSFIVRRPLSLLKYIFLYAWALVGIYFIVAYGFFTDNALMLGHITVILIPYMYLVFEERPRLRFIFSVIVLSYLMSISCRTAFMAASFFFVTYFLYPYLVFDKVRYRFFFLFFMTLIFLSMAIYLLSGFGFLDELSKMYFGKPLRSGRETIWPELFTYILDKPLFGYGINQDSGYFQSASAILKFRGLDSHNIYLEMLVRGGIVLLSFFMVLFYRIWGSFYSRKRNAMSRIAASGFISFLFLGAGLPIGLTGHIVLNSLLWFYWGVASGSSWIHNRAPR
ncbi:MAG: O-antigen ligase family protein [Deltaproteobacteria bacterium]|nr:O-antigen ligase family protein [Deltaproteobacteria bacterium]